MTSTACPPSAESRPTRRLVPAVVAAAPTVVFVAVAAVTDLTTALVATGVTAVTVFAVRVVRRESVRGALAGLAVAAVCVLVAALTGQARGFFLVLTLVPALVALVCLGTVLARRPLTGLLLNRLAGGPADWRRHPRLLRVHVLATLAAVAVNLVNLAVQVTSYRADRTLVLAAAHVATGPVFAALVAVTLVAARRALR